MTEDWNKAASDYTRLIVLDREDVGSYYFRGKCYYHTGKYQQAISDYTAAIALDPESHILWYESAEAHGKNGDADKAMADYKRGIELNPEYGDTLIDKGFGWLNVGINRFNQWWKEATSEKQ